MSRAARVVIASTRAAGGIYTDRCGPAIVAWLSERGFDVAPAAVVPDGPAVSEAMRTALHDRVDVLITSGAQGSRRRTSPPR